ncbi:hypothetical protein CI109_103198 [Kwoniella shandongensis]|uniref:Uncharacterized protein n=1 Tax=Kwoniella shandongensis TaxID=1734106 RepID=A0A5M6C8Q4_9TREE|nr:uncharacterized protein CI109_000388 [Kwoniella shandongensis]KAA5531546.1 hypothetical protein CI109_000388 [Kwoniella shandongensis]
MSSSSSQPTFGHYAFNLRDGLRKAARSTLQELEDNIARTGYEWLDGYMEQILNRESRAPITELMKTPSRTQTVKKTRATTAAAKDRTDKVKGLNARMALSPVNKQSSRAPLSPLGPRSLNAQTSPSLLAAPKPSPLKGKADKASKPKAKKGKSNKAVDADENTPPQHEKVDSAPPSHKSLTSSSSHSSSKEVSRTDPVKEKSKSSKSKKEKEKAPPPIEHMEIEIADAKNEGVAQQPQSASINVDEEPSAPTPYTLSVPNADTIKDLSMIEEGEEDSRTTSMGQDTKAESSTQATKQNSQAPTNAASPSDKEKAQATSTSTQQESAPAPHEYSTVLSAQAQPHLEAAIPSPAPAASHSTVNAAPLPVRQVRSSWLSKALGTGTVPVGLPEPNPSLRKSYAAPAQSRQSTAMDFTGLRKSLVPIGGLKRKSDEGMESDEEEEEEEEKRPDKFAKVSIEPTIKTFTEQPIVAPLPTRTPGPVPRPTMPTKTPSFGPVSVVHPDSQGRVFDTATDAQRSDIHRVTKALDELREKTAAKELAKQKAAALAASVGPSRMPQAKSTGTGFLRGLGSLGAGLLGMGGASAEEEAERLARELEEERLAEQELERLMREATKPETETGRELDKASEQKEEDDNFRSTTPDISPAHAAQQPLSPEEEEEMIEEQSILEHLIVVDPPQADDSQQASVPQEAESTTPTGTPTRPFAIHVEAPPLHARSEKHVHEISAAMHKETQNQRDLMNPRVQQPARSNSPDDEDEDMEEEEEEVEQVEPQRNVTSATAKGDRDVDELKTHRKVPSSSSSVNLLGMSTSSQATSSTLGQAATMAAKALGVKPPTGPVKSLQLASAAAKKEQAAADRKALMKDQVEQRKQLLAKKKAEEERVRVEEERKAKIAELEEKRKLRAEYEKRKKERDERLAAIAKEKAAKEEREAAAAKAKQAEEDAARKRKLAASLNKSQSGQNSVKRPPGQGLQQSQTAQKGKEPFRPSKQQISLSSSSSTVPQPQKMGPSVFRTAEATHHTQSQSSTITLVSQSQSQTQAQQNVERKALGPPSRPSAMAGHPQPQAMRQSTAVHQSQAHGQASVVLQQSRVALQTQLEEKAAMIQSEDIVLPDIASEYSDSDDEDRTRDFERPQWAESPELRHALEAQAHRNPDELFGPIKPLNMEELFKVRTGKFRARTSSANWSKGDGLTKAEEVEYAKRMGFKPIGSGSGSGSVF